MLVSRLSSDRFVSVLIMLRIMSKGLTGKMCLEHQYPGMDIFPLRSSVENFTILTQARDLLWAPEEFSSIISLFSLSRCHYDQYLAFILSIIAGHLSKSFKLVLFAQDVSARMSVSSSFLTFLFFRRNSTQLIPKRLSA